MKEQLEKYVELLFAGSPASEDMMQEILQNTLDKYDDYITQGKSPEAAYRLAISGIGDISELLGQEQNPPVPQSPAPANSVRRERPEKPMWKKILTAVAVGLYILCAIPLILFGETGFETLGLIATISIAAVATVAIIIASSGDTDDEDDKDDEEEEHRHQPPLQKAINSLVDVLGLIAYLFISFQTGAWHITWVIFPIIAALNGIVRAIFDLSRRDKA